MSWELVHSKKKKKKKKKSATYHKVLVISQERTTLPFLKKPIQVSVLYQEATTVVTF